MSREAEQSTLATLLRSIHELQANGVHSPALVRSCGGVLVQHACDFGISMMSQPCELYGIEYVVEVRRIRKNSEDEA